MNNNVKLAEHSCQKMKQLVNKVWISDNLPMLAAEERKAILKVYRKHFHTVDYDPITGICKCWVVEPEAVDFSQNTTVETIMMDVANPNTRAGRPVSQATRDLLGIQQPAMIILDTVDTTQL